jgi:hypothetical protein
MKLIVEKAFSFSTLCKTITMASSTRFKYFNNLVPMMLSQPYFEESVRMRLTLPEWELGSPPGLPKL